MKSMHQTSLLVTQSSVISVLEASATLTRNGALSIPTGQRLPVRCSDCTGLVEKTKIPECTGNADCSQYIKLVLPLVL